MKIVTLAAAIFLVVTYQIYAQDENHLKPKRPHIVLMMADDMGWNDVSFHGADQIPTPNIDALAYNGVMINRFYTLPTCSPSRSSFLTGQYAMRLGLQGSPLRAGENRHLPHDVPTLPQRLKDLGYSTNLVGKWHLGNAYKNVTPTAKGFDYHFGYWNGEIGYFNHHTDTNNGMNGLDMHENLEPMWATQYQYATHLFTDKAEEIIQGHDKSTPLFLAIMHVAPHTGEDNVVEIPDAAENNITFGYILDEDRRVYAGAIAELDKSVGRVVKALSDNGMIDNSVILFFSDNGAPTEGGARSNRGSNWPLRGLKHTVLEGGIRNVGVLYSSQLKNGSTVSNALVHISDWLPTLYAAAGGDVSQLGTLDGINQWDTLTQAGKSNRNQILIDIDENRNYSGLIGENGRYKLVNGTSSSAREIKEQNVRANDDYHGDDGRGSSNPSYNVTAVLTSVTNIALGNKLTHEKIMQLRQEGELADCRQANYSLCVANQLCLFDILNDPCETTDLVAELPEILEKLSKELLEYREQLKPQAILGIDPLANPIYHNNTWTTWLDV